MKQESYNKYREIDRLVLELRQEYEKEKLNGPVLSRKFVIKAFNLIRQIRKRCNEILQLDDKSSIFSDFSVESIWLEKSLERFKDDLIRFSGLSEKSIDSQIRSINSLINTILRWVKSSNAVKELSNNPWQIVKVINANDYEEIKDILFNWESIDYDVKWWVWRKQRLWKTEWFWHFFQMPMIEIKNIKIKWYSFQEIIVMSGLDTKLLSKYSWVSNFWFKSFDINKEEHFKAWLALIYWKKHLIQWILEWNTKSNEEDMIDDEILSTWKLTLDLIKYKFFNYRMSETFRFTTKQASYEYLLQFRRKDIEKIRLWWKKMSDIMKITWKPPLINFDPNRPLHFRIWLSWFFGMSSDYSKYMSRYRKQREELARAKMRWANITWLQAA